MRSSFRSGVTRFPDAEQTGLMSIKLTFAKLAALVEILADVDTSWHGLGDNLAPGISMGGD